MLVKHGMATSGDRTLLHVIRVTAGILYAVSIVLRQDLLYGTPGFEIPGLITNSGNDTIALEVSVFLFFFSTWEFIRWKGLNRPFPTLLLQVASIGLLMVYDLSIAATFSSDLTWTLHNALLPGFWRVWAVDAAVLMLCLMQLVLRIALRWAYGRRHRP